MHRAKGLEFRAVAVMGCEPGVVPLPKAVARDDEDDRTSAMEQERQLVYVATTRARERLLVTAVGQVSPLLKDALGGERTAAKPRVDRGKKPRPDRKSSGGEMESALVGLSSHESTRA
jgi:superfamily I DNA/RNA helicase